MDNPVNKYWKNCGKDEKTLCCKKLSTSSQKQKTEFLYLKKELSTFQQVLL